MIFFFCALATAQLHSQILWSGALTSTSVEIVVRSATDTPPSFRPMHESIRVAESVRPADDSSMIRFRVEGLRPNQRYTYDVGGLSGSLTTPAPENTPQSFEFLASACADTFSNSKAFEAMLQHEQALFYLNLGDIAYTDIDENSFARYQQLYDIVFSRERQRNFYKRLPIVYMWDDHDFGPNNADSTSPAKPAATNAYKTYAPHYALYNDT